MKLSFQGIAFCVGGSSIVLDLGSRGKFNTLKSTAPRGTNYCFKCHMLTGERPGLHSSFIATLCQMLLSIRELRARCALASAAKARGCVCLWIPRMTMTVMLSQCDRTAEGGVK